MKPSSDPPTSRVFSRRAVIVATAAVAFGSTAWPARAQPSTTAELTPSEQLFPADSLFMGA